MKVVTIECGVQYCWQDNGVVSRLEPGTGWWEPQISLIPEVREKLGIKSDRPKLVFAPSGTLERIWH